MPFTIIKSLFNAAPELKKINKPGKVIEKPLFVFDIKIEGNKKMHFSRRISR